MNGPRHLRNGQPTRRRRGFTLLELLVVMFILVLLAGVATVAYTKHIEEAKHVKAKADIDTLDTAIKTYHIQNGAYPPSLDALRTKPSGEDLPNWNGPYLEKPVPDDPWNQPYHYVVPGDKNSNSYDLYTLGKDGKEGGSGSDADVTNWE